VYLINYESYEYVASK